MSSLFPRRQRSELVLWELDNAMERDTPGDRPPVTSIKLAPGHGPLASDPLSVSNGVIGLIAAASQTHNDLVDLNVYPDGNTTAIDKARKAVKSFKATIQVLYKALRQFESNKLVNSSRPALVELDLLIGVLTESALVLSDLGNMLLEISDEAELLSVSTAVLCARHGDSILADANRVAKAETIITKIVSVLQVSDQTEALRHRDQADKLVREILQSDAALVDRMQQMQDVFDARSVFPLERTVEISHRAPPVYSAPTTRTEELPGYTETTSGPRNEDGSVTIHPGDWSIFSGLTLGDISILSLIPLPLQSGELRYGELYSNEYCRSVNDELAKLSEKSLGQRNYFLAQVLGLRQVGSDWDEKGFARRVGLQYDQYSRRGGPRRSRPQPDIRTGLT